MGVKQRFHISIAGLCAKRQEKQRLSDFCECIVDYYQGGKLASPEVADCCKVVVTSCASSEHAPADAKRLGRHSVGRLKIRTYQGKPLLEIRNSCRDLQRAF